MSQSDLASRSGVTFQQIQKYEHGTNRISASRLIELCEALHVSVNDILKGFQKGSPKQKTVLDFSSEGIRAAAIIDTFPLSRRRAALKIIESMKETD